MALEKKDFKTIEEIFDRRFKVEFQTAFDEVFKKFTAFWLTLPTRDEVMEVNENTRRELRMEFAEVKDQIAELRDDMNILNTFTQHRLSLAEKEIEDAKDRLKVMEVMLG